MEKLIGGIQFCGLMSCLCWAFIADLKYRRIPNACVATLGLVRLISLVLSWRLGAPSFLVEPTESLVGAISVFGFLLLSTKLAQLMNVDAEVGAGDIKLFTILGLYFGALPTLVLIAVSSFCMLVFWLANWVFTARRHDKSAGKSMYQTKLPMAPFIVVSTLILCCLFVL